MTVIKGNTFTPVANVTEDFRKDFANTNSLTISAGSGDIIQIDGNANGAEYLVISASPLLENTTTMVTLDIPVYNMPFEATIGLSLSQRVVGIENYVEFVDLSSTVAAPTPVAISSISQATTTLSVTTATAHDLTVGRRISIGGVNDSRMNYCNLVVATTPTSTTFTCTAGSGGTIPSVTAGPFTTGNVYSRSALNGAPNGTAMVFDNTTATKACFFTRNDGSNDATVSGTIAGDQTATIATTASVQAINAALNYAFQPTSEYRLSLTPDMVNWTSVAVDSLVTSTSRFKSTQAVPNINRQYNLRFRCENTISMPRPTAQIVSATKAGSTTATIVTDVAHGLTTADFVNIYGINDLTNFANLTTATAVASIVDTTTFTIVIPTVATTTSYGGFVARVNGGNNMSSAGVANRAAVSATITGGIITLVGSTTWVGQFLIGDYVNLVGVRNVVDGATLGIDGAYRVRDIQTTSAFLEAIGDTAVPADTTITNCGGAVIKRTDFRIGFARIYKYLRQRVELFTKAGSGDINVSIPVTVQNAPSVVTTGQAAHSAAVTSNPVRIAGKVITAVDTTLVASDTCDAAMSSSQQLIIVPHAPPDLGWFYAAAASGIVNTTTAVTIKAAGGASIRNLITSIQVMSEALGTATELAIRDGAGGTVLWRTKIPTGGLASTTFDFDMPLRGTANTLLEVVTLTASVTGAVYFNAQGYNGF